MTKYMLMLRADVTVDYSGWSPEDMQKVIQEYEAWSEGLVKDNRLVGGHKLVDEGGKVMRPTEAGIQVSDGPYAETKEVVGGYYIIDADSYDHALQLCEGHPNFKFGSIEIREVDFMGQPEE